LQNLQNLHQKERERAQERLQILQKQKREQNNLQQKKMENLGEEGGTKMKKQQST
jgi:septum formation topological specificity factor MinE